MLNEEIVHTTGTYGSATMSDGAKVSRTLPPYATELLFGIQVVVITGEPTKFVQLVEPGVNEENNKSETYMEEILLNDNESKERDIDATVEAIPIVPIGQFKDAAFSSCETIP